MKIQLKLRNVMHFKFCTLQKLECTITLTYWVYIDVSLFVCLYGSSWHPELPFLPSLLFYLYVPVLIMPPDEVCSVWQKQRSIFLKCSSHILKMKENKKRPFFSTIKESKTTKCNRECANTLKCTDNTDQCQPNGRPHHAIWAVSLKVSCLLRLKLSWQRIRTG